MQLLIKNRTIGQLQSEIEALERKIDDLLESHTQWFEAVADKAFETALATSLPFFQIAFLEAMVKEFRRGPHRQSATKARGSPSPKTGLPQEDQVAKVIRQASLTEREQEFLRILIQANGQPVRLEELIRRFKTRAVVYQLRYLCQSKLVRINPYAKVWIRTHQKLGYSFVPNTDESGVK